MILVLALVFTACSQTKPAAPAQNTAQTAAKTEEKKPETKEEAKKPVTIRMAAWGGEARFKLYDRVFDLYQKENPHVTLSKDYTAWNDYWIKKATQAAGGNLPDMTNVSWYSIREYSLNGSYVPLDQFVKTGQIDIKGFNETVLSTGKLNGVLYSLPIGVSIDGLMFNKTLIEKAGMKVPAYEITWDEYINFLLELQKKLPERVWASNDTGRDFKHLATWLRQKYGVEFYSADGKSLGYTKEQLKEWLVQWDNLRKAGAIVPASVSAELEGGDPWADTVQAKNMVCAWMSPDNQLTIYQLYTKNELVIGRTPVMPNGKNKYGEILLMTGFALSKNSKIPDETLKLINWFPRSIEGNRIFYADQGFVGVPDVAKLLLDMAAKESPQKLSFFKHAESVTTSQPPAPPTIPWAIGSTAVVSAYERQYDELRYGRKNIDQVVNDFFIEADKLLKK